MEQTIQMSNDIMAVSDEVWDDTNTIHLYAELSDEESTSVSIKEKQSEIKAYIVGDELKEVTFKLGDLTDVEREIILKGCLINYYRG